MPRERPQLSITLPRNFVFHYTEGDEPKTPEREIPAPVPQSPRPVNAIRIKRRSRPSVNTIFQNGTGSIASSDVPIPTIETPISVAPMRPLFQQRATEPANGYLAPLLPRKFMTLPRTPEPQQQQSTNGWQPFSHQDLGESLSRPMSACSLLSDSSDDSNLSLMSYPAGDGSCTSPESDAPDPFKFTTIKKTRSKQWAAALINTQGSIENGLSSKMPIRVRWTPEMDKHLWSTYLVYLQDPTVTPFKMLPASTSASMQPNGPLAQLAAGGRTTTQSNEWFNEPPVPWASPTAIPSDVVIGIGASEADNTMQTPHLGSPFGYHTWGPSRSRQRIRPSTSRIQSTDASSLEPSLRSPIRLHDTFPYPSVQKRRALHELEDELSPGGSSMQQELLDNLFGSAAESRHRRVRSRGFSLGDVHTSNRLENLFIPPHSSGQMPTPKTTSSPTDDNPTTPTQTQRLGSPFHGFSPRPSRSRYVTRASLGAYEPFSSIGETLGQSMDTSDPQTPVKK
ncbi:hypothetical protein OEA41_002331 [Lepraria neglecta]|uniref:Uncharacterized protein n=1 Tax=Lepraria neglecta TaxID=209136 RepID=A0AAD9ZBV0_9LECA|nr:hypothetical protein OEA41_002331 [Lepraria neglecta]